MKISKEDVLHVAELARLELDDASIEKFAGQIGDILEYVEAVGEVNTEGVPPSSHAIFLTNALREDRAAGSGGAEDALCNAPRKENGFFTVPKVVG